MTDGVLIMVAGALLALARPAHDLVTAWRWHRDH